MSIQARQQEILRILEERKSVNIHYLKSVLAVSEPTVRNDLRYLESQGKLQRSHGGAVQIQKPQEMPYVERYKVNLAAKREIGRVAATMLKQGETVFLDAGSTIMTMAEQLPDHIECNAVTAALHIALEAGKHPGISVHLVGGLLRPSLQELIGPKAIEGIRQIHAHKVFLSVSGVDLEKGLTENHLLSSEVKRAMVESADEVIVLADSSKWGTVHFARVLPVAEVDILVTDEDIDEESCRALEERGVRVLVASTEGQVVDRISADE